MMNLFSIQDLQPIEENSLPAIIENNDALQQKSIYNATEFMEFQVKSESDNDEDYTIKLESFDTNEDTLQQDLMNDLVEFVECKTELTSEFKNCEDTVLDADEDIFHQVSTDDLIGFSNPKIELTSELEIDGDFVFKNEVFDEDEDIQQDSIEDVNPKTELTLELDDGLNFEFKYDLFDSVSSDEEEALLLSMLAEEKEKKINDRIERRTEYERRYWERNREVIGEHNLNYYKKHNKKRHAETTVSDPRLNSVEAITDDEFSDNQELDKMNHRKQHHVRRNRKRRWINPVNEQRKTIGEYHTLMPQLRENPVRFYLYFRITMECFDKLLSHISGTIRKQDSNCRESISPEERLVITLRFLATGHSFLTIGQKFKVGSSTVSLIVKQVCQAICEQMKKKYMPHPTEAIWKNAEKGFREIWRFPNCIGIIDAKHVTTNYPPKTKSKYYTYLKNSFVILAIVGPSCKFIAVDVGGHGRDGFFEESEIGRLLFSGKLNIPGDKYLPGKTERIPHVLVGDETFSLKINLMRPFPQRHLKGNREEKKNFNDRLCKTRGAVENVFSILARKWRLYCGPLKVHDESAKLIVMATCVLHNFILDVGDSSLHEQLEEPERIGSTFVSLEADGKRSSNYACVVREKFMQYFKDDL